MQNTQNYDLSNFKGTKKEFIRMYADACGISQGVALTYVDNFFNVLEMFLVNSPAKKMNFIGWGGFQVVQRKERTYRLPGNDNRVVKSEAKNVLRFKAGKRLRSAVTKTQ